jgi:hypothetical protein
LHAASEKFYLKKYAHGATDQQIIALILNSSAFKAAVGATEPADNNLLVVALYTDLLNRPPTGQESTFWTDRLDGGTKLSVMIGCLLDSHEYKQDLVQNYYTIYLGRSPDQSEEAAWTKDLGHVSSQRFLSHLLSSPEYFQNHPGAS